MTIENQRDPLLVERRKTHGDFGLNASVSQSLKRVFNDYKYKSLKVEHSEALDMIALKLSRILSGQADFKDHWDDIAGYAKLASEACPLSRTDQPTRIYDDAVRSHHPKP